MMRSREKIILFSVILFGAIATPFLIRRPPQKDWIIIFLFAGFLSGIMDLFVTSIGLVKYPVKFFGNKTRISLVWDYLLFPLLGVFYNQITYRSKFWGILVKAFYISIPQMIFEYFIERHTKLVEWKRWNWFIGLFSITLVFWFERAFIALLRLLFPTNYKQKNT